MSKLVSEYRALMQELRDRFGHFIIIGARPNTSDQISGMSWVSRQLSIAFATDDHITLVDIFEHSEMLTAARGSKGRINMTTRAHPARGGIIHYNQQEAQCFLRIVDKTIQSVDARYVKAKPARGGNEKKGDTFTPINHYMETIQKKYMPVHIVSVPKIWRQATVHPTSRKKLSLA